MEEAKQKNWYDKWHKLMLLPPLLLFVISLIYLGIFYNTNGDFIFKDSSLAGGSTITINKNIDSAILENSLKAKFEDVKIREIRDLTTGELIAVIVDSSSQPDVLKLEIESILGFELNSENSSIEFTGPSLSQNFYKQLIIAILFSFILMSIVIFFLFKSFIPSITVVFATLSDIILTLAAVDILGVNLSSAGIAAFLMLIGYGVDTNILLTTRVLKKTEGTLNNRIFSSFKTGIFMTTTGLLTILPAFFIVTTLPDSFKQIFLILGIGFIADIVNTWIVNAGIIRWYAEAKGIK